MTKDEIYAFLNANRNCFMATVEGNKPHVRGMGIIKADEDGIILQTGAMKDVCKQLLANPNVELCFFDPKDFIQVRVNGAVEPVDEVELKDEIIAQRPYLKPAVEEEGYGVMAVYRLRKGKATVWTWATNVDPKTHTQFPKNYVQL